MTVGIMLSGAAWSSTSSAPPCIFLTVIEVVPPRIVINIAMSIYSCDNCKGGRCESCRGEGYKKMDMHFLPDAYVVCELCKGLRFNDEILAVRWKGKNIADVLSMSISEAYTFFKSSKIIERRLKSLIDVGLGYIKLGQSSLTFSGGESQRIKLATQLSKAKQGKTLYTLDEPTNGLHFSDIKMLIKVLIEFLTKF